jgi:hypothetical protein
MIPAIEKAAATEIKALQEQKLSEVLRGFFLKKILILAR